MKVRMASLRALMLITLSLVSIASIAETVAAPLEEQINGVENMLYMGSQATTDGVMTLTITFKIGTNPEAAETAVQNRINRALPRLPEIVRQIGVTTEKSSPNLTMVVHMVSPDNTRDALYLRNYAQLQVRDELLRVQGMGSVQVFGSGEYAMRVWVDPAKLAARAAGSLFAHIALYALFSSLPDSPPRIAETIQLAEMRQAVHIVYPRVEKKPEPPPPPKELTQKAPNKGKISRELDIRSASEASQSRAPAAPPPSPPPGASAPPQPVIEAPKLEAVVPPAAPGIPNPTATPSLTPPPPEPKQQEKISQQQLTQYMNDPFQYVNFDIPYNLFVGYNLNYSKRGALDATLNQSLTFNGDLSLTPKWKIGFNSWYDMRSGKFTSFSTNIYRDLHCWEMKLNWIPFGGQESYSFQINVKSSVLQDLKLNKRKDFFN